jgi:hypothetical protein
MTVTETPYPEVPPQAPQPVYANHNYPVSYKYPMAKNTQYRVGQKIKVAFYTAILFVLLSYSGVYRVTNNIVSAFLNQPFDVVSEHGCPTMKGVFLHTIAFFILTFILLNQL